MHVISQIYFDKAVEGQRRTLQNLNDESFETAFVASAVILDIALFSLGSPKSDNHDQSSISWNESLWFRLASGTHEIVRNWMQCTGADVLRRAVYFNMEPDFFDDEEIFHRKH